MRKRKADKPLSLVLVQYADQAQNGCPRASDQARHFTQHRLDGSHKRTVQVVTYDLMERHLAVPWRKGFVQHVVLNGTHLVKSLHTITFSAPND